MSVRKSGIRLTDLLNPKELQDIQNSLASLSGLSIVIFDPDGRMITWQSPRLYGSAIKLYNWCQKVFRRVEIATGKPWTRRCVRCRS